MRASEFITEGHDSRSTIEKLQDLINHPSTEDHIRQNAIEKLNKLRAKEGNTFNNVIYSIPTNVEINQMNQYYLVGIKIKDIYNSLSQLHPTPNYIAFYRTGEILIIVPPPFYGVKKEDYYKLILEKIPGIKKLTSQLRDDASYIFRIYML